LTVEENVLILGNVSYNNFDKGKFATVNTQFNVSSPTIKLHILTTYGVSEKPEIYIILHSIYAVNAFCMQVGSSIVCVSY